jgi:hypothetical protein
MTTTLSLPDTNELEKLSNLSTELALQSAAPFLAHLVREPAFLDACGIPLLQTARIIEDWYVAQRCDGQDGSYSLQVFVWPPGTRTQIHDHTSWELIAAWWDRCSKSATNALMTALCSTTPV